MNLKYIPLHNLHLRLGAKMVPFAGFSMPVRYSSDIEEHMAVRQSVGVFDVSHMGEFRLRGKHALDLIQYVTSNDASKLVSGQAQYSCMPNETGGIVDDLIVYKFNEEDYMLVVNASNIEKDWNWIGRFNKHEVAMENVSDDICLFAVQGPNANAVVQKLTDVNLNEVKYYHFRVGRVADVPDVILSHTGYTGAGGFEVYVQRNYAEKIWHALFDAGKEYDIRPVGLGARDTLRLEMGYCLYGNDIDETTSPLEAGLGWITKFSKTFVNSDYLKRQKEEGIKRKLVGFQMLDKGIPRHDYIIRDASGTAIGKVTSGSLSPVLNTGIGMGYVPASFAQPDTTLFIDVRGRLLKARVCQPPFIEKKT